MVTPLPRRRPWKLAREAASVDALSQGRLVVGVGSGDVREPGFRHFGEELDAKRRAELLDEGLAILTGLWSGEPFSYQGTHYRVEEVAFLPKPVQQPRIPIWVGGGWPNKGPVERALRWDGAVLYNETRGGPWQDMTAQEVRTLREMVEQKRGTAEGYDIEVGGRRRGEDWKQEQVLIQTLAEAVIYLVLYTTGVNTIASIAALRTSDGVVLWRYTPNVYAMQLSPAVADGLVLIALQDGSIAALRASSGSLLWRRVMQS